MFILPKAKILITYMWCKGIGDSAGVGGAESNRRKKRNYIYLQILRQKFFKSS